MPRVPVNTVSEGRMPRLDPGPQVRSNVASALGSVAASMGRAQGAVSQGIAATRASFDERRRATLMQGRAEEAKWGAVGGVAESVSSSAAMIARISDRRSAERADEALTHLNIEAERNLNGYVDETTGQRVAGAFEATYVPSGTEAEPSGATVSAAKWFTEYLSSPGSPAAKLSPSAREKFDKRAVELRATYMRRANGIDHKNYLAHRAAADEASEMAAMRQLESLSADTDPTAWSDAASLHAEAHAIRKHRSGLKDPGEMDPSKAEWRSPEDEALANEFLLDFLRKAATEKALAHVAAARAATTDAEAQAHVAAIAEAVMWHPDGADAPLVSPENRARISEAATGALEERVRARAAQEARDIRDAMEAGVDLALGRTNDPSKYEALAARIPPERVIEIAEMGDRVRAAKELASFEMLADEAMADPSKRVLLPLAAKVMTTRKARSSAQADLAEWRNDLAEKIAKADAEALEAFADLAVATRSLPTADGSATPADRFALTQAVLRTYESGAMGHSKFSSLMDRLSQKADEVAEKTAPVVMERLGAKIGAENLADMFKYANGAFGYATTGTAERKKPTVRPEASIGRSGRVNLTANLASHVLNSTIEFVRENGGATPEEIDATINRLLDPSDNKAARDWTEHNIMENLKSSWQTLSDIRSDKAADAYKATRNRALSTGGSHR